MSYGFRTINNSIFPQMVVVSTTNACNYQCSHCYFYKYVASPDYTRHDIDTSVFRKIVDEMGHYPHSTLRFIAWGEPLLHPKMIDLMTIARRAAPANKITLITNGYVMNEAYSNALMKAGLNLVEVSIDAARPETYSKLRTSLPNALNIVEENTQEMIKNRDKDKYSTRVVVSFILYPTIESEEEFKLFKEKWEGVADEIVCRPAHTFLGVVRDVAPLPQVRVPCYGLWARCNINPWGQISVCYNDWENKNIVGDLRDPNVTIAEVWQGQTLKKIRDGQCQGVFTGICEHCKDYNPNAWQAPYEVIVNRCDLPE